MLPVIDALNRSYEIVIVIEPSLNHFHFNRLKNDLGDMKLKEVIKSYFILPPLDQVINQYKFLYKCKAKLQSYSFDIWLANEEARIISKYIIKCCSS